MQAGLASHEAAGSAGHGFGAHELPVVERTHRHPLAMQAAEVVSEHVLSPQELLVVFQAHWLSPLQVEAVAYVQTADSQRSLITTQLGSAEHAALPLGVSALYL